MRLATVLRAAVPALVLLTAGCATPMMPSGGPPDRTPPALLHSTPAADSVNVSTDRLLLEFSKPIEPASLQTALAIAPDFLQRPQVIVRGHRAEVRFPEPLRENTTYVVTIGTELRDLRNNRLPAPITLAFATGPQLDQGQIEGWVRDPRSGAGVADIHLFAYAMADTTAPLPDPRVAEADYRTQTDNQGRFQFSYLREIPFFVVAVEDLNRNRRADPGERFAPPPEPWITPSVREDTVASAPLALFVTRVDTLAPEPLRIRARTDSRFAVRFTEPVLLADRDPGAFAVTDSLTGETVPIRDVYADDDPTQIALHTGRMAQRRYRLALTRPAAVLDTAGNAAVLRDLFFTPSAEPDTARARIVAFEPLGSDTLRVLAPNQRATVRLTQPPVSPIEQVISVQSAAGEPIPTEISTTDGIRYRLNIVTADHFDVRVRRPDTTHVMRFRPLPADSLGDIVGRVTGIGEGERVLVEATPARGEAVLAPVNEDGSFAIRALPAGPVRLRVFRDGDGSSSWSGGLLSPFHPPDPLRILPEVRVRARWETEVDPVVLDPSQAPPPTAEPQQPEFVDPEQEEVRRGPGSAP